MMERKLVPASEAGCRLGMSRERVIRLVVGLDGAILPLRRDRLECGDERD